MTKKNIVDLTNEELVKVYHANEKLREDIYEDMLETEMYYISEQMDYFRGSLSNWSIGAHQRNYLSIRNADDFIEAMERVDKEIPILTDSETPTLEKAIDLRERYRDTEIDSDEFDELEKELYDIADDLADLVVDRFTDILDSCGEAENQISYLIEFYVESRLDGNEFYIIVNEQEESDYTLYENLVKSYK